MKVPAQAVGKVRRGIAAAAALLLIAFASRGPAQLPDRDLDRLSAALHEMSYRPIAGALSSDFAYRPYKSHVASDDLPLLVRVTAGELSRSAERPHFRGLAFLITGQTNQALRNLREAASQTPSADVWSDLAAAYLSIADEMKSGEAAVEAVAAATTALRIDPEHEPARFNRMLALERLGLPHEAALDARLYLKYAAPSPWTDEAALLAAAQSGSTAQRWKSNLPRLREVLIEGNDEAVQQLVKEFPQQARRWAEGVLLAEWADAALKGDDHGASQALRSASAIGSALVARSGESLLADACVSIREADGERRRTLVAAHRLYRDGRIAHSNHDHALAESLLRKASEEFRTARSPMTLVAEYYVGSSLYFQFRVPEAAALLDDLAARVEKQHHGYRALTAQIGWERGLCALVRGSHSDALEIFEKSRHDFDALGEYDLAATFDALAAETLDFLDDPDAAWIRRTLALRQLSSGGNETRILVSITAAADDRLRREEWRRALALYDIASRIATRIRHTELAAHVFTKRSIVHARLKDVASAEDDLRDAESWIRHLSDRTARRRAETEWAMANALMTRADPTSAIAAMDSAVAYYLETASAYVAPILLERARAHRRRGDADAARRDLLAGIDILETHRGEVRDLSQRAAMFAAADSLFEEAIADALARNDVPAAFALSERARARSILEGLQLTSNHGQAPKLDEILNALANDAAIVTFISSRGRMAAIVLHGANATRVDLGPSPIIHERSGKLNEAMSRANAAEAMSLSSALYEHLVRPIRSVLDGANAVAWVPDAALRGIPFAALYDRQRDRFVIEDFIVVEAPSAAVAITASRRAGIARSAPALAIAATSFDRTRFAHLESLAEAEREARSVARLREDSQLLIGADAVPAAVLKALPTTSLFHFAGHAVDGRTAGDAALILAPDASGDSTIAAREIAKLRLSMINVVVLTACRSSTQRGARGDGPESVASAFLLAGVPTVVATPWPVEDQSAAEFSELFHRELVTQSDPATALRDALRSRARDAERRPRSPASWAEIVPIGGSKALIR